VIVQLGDSTVLPRKRPVLVKARSIDKHDGSSAILMPFSRSRHFGAEFNMVRVCACVFRSSRLPPWAVI
jgi:hypothetical protein